MNYDAGINLDQMAQSASRASALMKTLGHKDRLMILCHLTDGEKSVGEIAELLQISPVTLITTPVPDAQRRPGRDTP